MDIFTKFANLQQSLGQFNQNAQQYMDCVNGLRDIAGRFENGGFMGEMGDLFNQLLNRDMSVISEFAELFQQAAGLLGETMDLFTDTDNDIKSRMPG